MKVECIKLVEFKIGTMGFLSSMYAPLSCIGNKVSRILVVVFWLPHKLLNPIDFMPFVTALLCRVHEKGPDPPNRLCQTQRRTAPGGSSIPISGSPTRKLNAQPPVGVSEESHQVLTNLAIRRMEQHRAKRPR
jgi:hypothetical protein